MSKRILIFSLLFLCLDIISCNSNDSGTDWGATQQPGQEEQNTDLRVPDECDNIVMAHRGGSSESGFPDNSIAGLNYTISLGCYGAECDIYITKDDEVVVAHADGDCRINGLHPWEATLKQIRAGGSLSNGEQIPTLGEFIDVLLSKKECCTKLVLDIKNITVPSTLTQYPIRACRKACEIIKEKKAKNFVEFICTGNATVMESAFMAAQNGGIPCAWMSNRSAAEYVSRGYNWANLSVEYLNDGIHGGPRSIDEFVNKGIAFSVYVVDNDSEMNYYVGQSAKLKAIATNYPRKLLGKFGISR